MNALAKLIFIFCTKIIAITICGCAVFVLIAHFRLGNASPGVMAITESAMGFWIPLIIICFTGLPLILGCRIIWLARLQASEIGLSLRQYFEIPQEERERLVSDYRKKGKAL